MHAKILGDYDLGLEHLEQARKLSTDYPSAEVQATDGQDETLYRPPSRPLKWQARGGSHAISNFEMAPSRGVTCHIEL